MNIRRFAEYLAVPVVFIVLTALYFYPAFSRFGSAIIGPPEDNTQFLWYLWYGTRALFDPALEVFHTRLMYYPEGMGLWYANYFYYGVAVAAAIKPLVGLVASYNLLVLSSFVLAGWSTYALLKELTRDRVASFCGAFIYAFSPLHFAHALHHPTVASVQFLPLFLLFVIRAHRHGGWKDRIGAAVMLAVSAYCDWNYLVYGGLCLVLTYPWTAWTQKRIFTVRGFLNLFVIGGGAILLVLPVLGPMILIGLRHPNAPVLPGQDLFVADLAGFVMPHAYHALSGVSWVQDINSRMTGTPWEQAVYLGWVNILIVVAGLIKTWRRSVPYLAAFGVMALLSMGVHLHVAGRITDIALPYQWLTDLPLLKQARNPSRVMALGYLFWAILTAFAIQAIFRAPSKKLKHQLGLVLIMGIGFMDLYAVNADMTPVELPAAYEPILKDPEYAERGFAVMNIPWDKGHYSMEQTLHGLPDMQGYIGRKFSVPLIGKLPFGDLAKQKGILRENRVKYILLRKKRMSWDPSAPEEMKIFDGVSKLARVYASVYEKVYEDDNAAIFKVY